MIGIRLSAPPDRTPLPGAAGSGVAVPWPGLCALVLVGLALRLAFALASQNLHHPDETFQYLEQAHRAVFGYGLVPWEYRFGTRSWLLPLGISAPLLLSKLLHLDDPAVYVPLVKSLFCVLSVTLIVSCYRIGRNLVSEGTGRLAAIFACFWYELVYFAPRPLTDAVATYFLVAALAYVTDPREGRRPILFGLCAAAAGAIRMQYLPIAGLMFLFVVATWNRREVVKSIAALLGMALLVGYLDKVMWGAWFVSYYNSYVFNVTHGVSTIFSTRGPGRYALELGVTSAGLFPIAALLSLGFIRRLWLPGAWLLMVVGVHSLISHKEYRFIFAAIPILLVVIAAVTILIAERVTGLARRARVPQAAICVMALVSLAGIQGLLPWERAIYPYKPLYAQQDELRAFGYLRRQADLAGVLLKDVRWWHTGGYYYLHRDIPLYLHTDEAAMHRDGDLGPQAYVSHIVCPASTAEIPGFASVARFGRLDVRKQLTARASYAILPSYSRHAPQGGVDDVYRPSVKPRL